MISVQVVTAGGLVHQLIAAFEAAPLKPGERNSPLNILKTACAQFEAMNTTAGLDSLSQFQRRASEKIQDPAVAKTFVDDAQAIIDLVKAQVKVPAVAKPRGKR
jgi:hypothetical protein